MADETVSDSQTREARHARLRSLADSINDTARMARGTLSLVLLVALYLGLTLLSSTDENFLRNSQVVLPPPVGTGLSVLQSYIWGPLIFLYLHGQVLLILIVLERKVRTFEAALSDEFPNTTTQDAGKDVEKKKSEHRDWLSAFTFVQVFRRAPGAWYVSRAFVWLGIDAIPLFLLFFIDLSFLRYQSAEITWLHHTVFIVDLLFLVYFNLRVFGRNLKEVFEKSGAETTRRLRIWVNGAVTLVKGMVAFGMVILLIFAAQPPSEIEDQNCIWHGGNLCKNGENLLDAGCRWLDGRQTCRYLDVSNKWLLNPMPDEPNIFSDEGLVAHDQQTRVKPYDEPDKFGNDSLMDMPRGPHLAERKLRFAKFRSARLQDTYLREAQLQGADFENAWLQGANLDRAKMTGARLVSAHFEGANLQGAVMTDAKLRGGHFEEAELVGADLVGADLEGAEFEGANLQGAVMTDAKLRGSHFEEAELVGADLARADLTHADLRKAKLVGADLEGAALAGVNLGGADMKKANLKGVTSLMKKTDKTVGSFTLLAMLIELSFSITPNLQEVDLEDANLQDASLKGGYLTANLRGANLRGANLTGADLAGTDLAGADLAGADLTVANLTVANLTGADLAGADLTGADLRQTKGISCSELRQAKNWDKAHRDKGLKCGATMPIAPLRPMSQSLLPFSPD